MQQWQIENTLLSIRETGMGRLDYCVMLNNSANYKRGKFLNFTLKYLGFRFVDNSKEKNTPGAIIMMPSQI